MGVTQGGESNFTGTGFERSILDRLVSLGFEPRNCADDADNRDMFARRRVLLNAPYTSIYGCTSRSEFKLIDELYSGATEIRIEARWQETPGSVDEKMAFLLLNAEMAMPEREIWIVVGGGGARDKAIEWLRINAERGTFRKMPGKSVRVFTFEEMCVELRRRFRTASAAE